MELRKGYKQTEVGVIPSDWEGKYLSEVCSTSKARINPLFVVEDYKCIELEHLSQETGRLLGYVDIKGLKSQKSIFKKGDVLFGKLRPYLRKYLYSEFDGACTTEIWVLQGFKEIDGKWLFYLIQSDRIINAANQSTGTKMPRAEWKTVSETFIPLPPNKSEQTAIATALSDADALISSLEKLIEKKRNIKQGVMQELLRPKKGWVESKLTDVVDYIHGKAHEQDIVEDGRYTVVNSKFVSTEGAVSKYSNSNFCPARKNDLLTVLSDLPNGKALAKCFFVELDNNYAVNQRVCIWRSKWADPRFLFYILNRNKYFLAINDGVSQTHILNHHIEKCRIFIPLNIDEQKEIATILSDMDNEITSLERKLSKSKMVKQGMMQELLTGKIRLI